MSIYFIIPAMLFMHVFDDYFLQSAFLNKGKQKSWWKENNLTGIYRFDYIVCLIMHAMSWSFCIMLPIAIAYHFNVSIAFLIVFIINTIVHAIVDDKKANKYTINLIEDQCIHMAQIAFTILIFVLVGG